MRVSIQQLGQGGLELWKIIKKHHDFIWMNRLLSSEKPELVGWACFGGNTRFACPQAATRFGQASRKAKVVAHKRTAGQNRQQLGPATAQAAVAEENVGWLGLTAATADGPAGRSAAGG